MTYFYVVSWSDYEAYVPTVFYSEKKWGEETFKLLIKKLAKETVDELTKNKSCDTWIGVCKIIEGYEEWKDMKVVFKIKGVWDKLKDHGFSKLEYQVDYDMWGSGIIYDDDFADLKQHMDKETLEKICKHNKKIGDELHIAMRG